MMGREELGNFEVHKNEHQNISDQNQEYFIDYEKKQCLMNQESFDHSEDILELLQMEKFFEGTIDIFDGEKIKTREQHELEIRLQQYTQHIEYAIQGDRMFDGIDDTTSKENEEKFYKELLNDNYLNIKEKNPILYRNMIDYLQSRNYFEGNDIVVDNFENQVVQMLQSLFNNLGHSLNYRIDSYEEIIEFLIREKESISEDLSKYESAYEKNETYLYIQNQKIKYTKLSLQYKEGNQSIDASWNISMQRLFEYLESDYRESLYGGEPFDVNMVQGLVGMLEKGRKVFSSGIEFDVSGIGEFGGEFFHFTRGFGYMVVRFVGDMLKTLNHQVFFDPSTQREGFVESSVYNNIKNPYEYYYTPQGIAGVANILVTVVGDMIIDLGVGATSLLLKPDDFIHDIKKLPIMVKELNRIGIEKLWDQYMAFYGDKPKEGFANSFYYFIYLTGVWTVAKHVPNIPNVFTKGTEWMGKGSGIIVSKNISRVKRRELKKVEKQVEDLKIKQEDLKRQEVRLGIQKQNLDKQQAEIARAGEENMKYQKLYQESRQANKESLLEASLREDAPDYRTIDYKIHFFYKRKQEKRNEATGESKIWNSEYHHMKNDFFKEFVKKYFDADMKSEYLSYMSQKSIRDIPDTILAGLRRGIKNNSIPIKQMHEYIGSMKFNYDFFHFIRREGTDVMKKKMNSYILSFQDDMKFIESFHKKHFITGNVDKTVKIKSDYSFENPNVTVQDLHHYFRENPGHLYKGIKYDADLAKTNYIKKEKKYNEDVTLYLKQQKEHKQNNFDNTRQMDLLDSKQKKLEHEISIQLQHIAQKEKLYQNRVKTFFLTIESKMRDTKDTVYKIDSAVKKDEKIDNN